jgi:hypothetical protein
MRFGLVLGITLMSLIVAPVMGQLTEDTFATWTMNPYAWEGKPLPSMGLDNSTSKHLSLTYNLVEPGLPPSVDWRNTPYGTRVTPVKDQDGCGSCVAHAIVGQIESAIEIAQNSSKPLPDLAEMELFSHGGSCGSGWIFERAYPVAQSTGIMTQNCYDSGTCKDRAFITSWTTTRDPKTALQSGPIVTGCDWDTPWFDYSGGIINDYTGNVAGGHAIECVGYNDPGQYWIFKNSWGTGWGESGFFRVSYTAAAEAGMGTSYPWYTVKVGSGPIPPGPTPTNLTFSARQISSYYSTTGNYLFGTCLPDVKNVMTTSTARNTYPSGTIGTYPSGQKFVYTLTTPTGITYYSDPARNADKTSHCTVFNLQNNRAWLMWKGIKSKYSSDAMIEIWAK